MPIYEYECSNCGHRLEAVQHMSDQPLTLCGECGKKKLVKLISESNFHLKGKGWYKTDYGTGVNKDKPKSKNKKKKEKK